MHLTLAVFGLIILPNLVDPLPRIDAVAYHQSIFKRPATVSSTQKYGQIISADSKSDPLRLFMRVFNDSPFLRAFSGIFNSESRPRIQTAPKVEQHLVNVTQLNGQKLEQRDPPSTQFSIDERASEMKDRTTESFEWKTLLLGPSGLLTTVFNELKERYKMELGQIKPNLPQSDLTPDQNNFGRLFEAFLSKAKSGNFEEPLPELPFIGICNRISCGDIYKAVDEFRKSEFFSNFQTAISLLNDPKGWDIISEMLENPDLIENFVSGKGEIASGTKTLGKPAKDDLTGEDGDLGIDLSTVEDGKTIVKGADRAVAIISANLDYYSVIDNGAEGTDKEERIVDHVDIEEGVLANQTNQVPANQTGLIPALPEISESIDAAPQEYGALIEETISIPKQTEQIKEVATTTSTASATTTKNFRVNDPYYMMYYDH